MKLYRWDSSEREFVPARETRIPRSTETKDLRIGKGERTRSEVATGDLLIEVLEGACRMEIANRELTVHHDEAVVIPSGFSHRTEAIEDSVAVQSFDVQQDSVDESMWAV
jgi:mannose-6-phosphate isomerase-like protein (cupin superfamily)